MVPMARRRSIVPRQSGSPADAGDLGLLRDTNAIASLKKGVVPRLDAPATSEDIMRAVRSISMSRRNDEALERHCGAGQGWAPVSSRLCVDDPSGTSSARPSTPTLAVAVSLPKAWRMVKGYTAWPLIRGRPRQRRDASLGGPGQGP